jgi:peptide/nickel transport system permease protein
LPSFWVAGMVILVFAVWLGWFPPSHMHSVGADQLSGGARLADLLHHLVLPALCLGVVGAAATARYLRATLIETGTSRFVLAARARGLSERRILWVHSLRPALLPVATLIGLSVPFLVSGSVVVESIFSWPGMGRVLWLSAQARDVPVVLGVTLVGALAVVLGNLLADLLYAVVDPRVREQR